MRYLFIFLISNILISTCLAKEFTVISPNNCENFNMYNNNHRSHLIPQRELSLLEKKVFGKSFPKESDIFRIETLEMHIYGSIQYGNIYNRFRQLSQTILANAQSQKKSVFNALENYFSGQLTGYTPDIYSSQNKTIRYPYGRNYYNSYNNNPFYNGFKYYNQNQGVGNSIKILD